MRHDEAGFTLNELIIGLGGIVSFALFGLAVYAAIHFIHKLW